MVTAADSDTLNKDEPPRALAQHDVAQSRSVPRPVLGGVALGPAASPRLVLRSTVAIQQPLGEQGTQAAAWMGRPRGRWDRDGRTHSYAAHGKAATLETREANYPWV